MVLASMRVMLLAMMSGHSPRQMPYVSHRDSPVTSTRNIFSEMSVVERVRQTLSTCGI
jgi:hypothetical protein